MPEGLRVEPDLARLTHQAKHSPPSRDDHDISIIAPTTSTVAAAAAAGAAAVTGATDFQD